MLPTLHLPFLRRKTLSLSSFDVWFTSGFHRRPQLPLVSLAAPCFSAPLRHHPHPLHFGLGSFGERGRAAGTLLWAWRGFGGGHRLTSGAAGVIYCKQAHRQWLPRTAGVVAGKRTQVGSRSWGLSPAALKTQSTAKTFCSGLNFHTVIVAHKHTQNIELNSFSFALCFQWEIHMNYPVCVIRQVSKVNHFLNQSFDRLSLNQIKLISMF